MKKGEQEENTENKEDGDDIHIIGQGSYGCIYRPNIGCATKKAESKTHLSKIQRLDRTTRNEIAISKLIRATIPRFANRFAPIIESCPITLGEMTDSNVQKCKMMQHQHQHQNQNQNQSQQFVSNKMRFAGKHTLGDYLEKELHRTPKKSNQYMKKLVNAHNELLTSLTLLHKANILHLDLKHNNIMVSDKTGRPIIIDFGLSFQTNHLALDKYQTLEAEQFFGIETPYYPPWCVEINVLSFLSRRLRGSASALDTSLATKVIDNNGLEDIHSVVQNFVKKHSFLQSKDIVEESALAAYKSKLSQWMAQIKGKTWSETWEYVAKSHATWDNYSVCVLFLTELQLADKLNTPIIEKYVDLMKRVILSPPEERLGSLETQKELQALFSRVPRKEYKKVLEQGHNEGHNEGQNQNQNQNETKTQNQKRRIKKNRLEALESEAYLRKRRLTA